MRTKGGKKGDNNKHGSKVRSTRGSGWDPGGCKATGRGGGNVGYVSKEALSEKPMTVQSLA